MGGEVCVAVKDPSGREHVSLRWTNPMPLWLADPAFYMEPAKLQEFIDEARPRVKWPKSVKVRTITPSDYGVILIDFPNKRILSRQGYCGTGWLSVWGANGGGDEGPGLAVKLSDMGWIDEVVTVGRARHTMGPEELVAFITKCRSGEPFDTCARVHFQVPGWINDHNINRAHDCWPEVTDWLKANGWTAAARNYPPERD